MGQDIISVELIDSKKLPPLIMTEHAAKICYQAETPQLKTEEDEAIAKFVKNRLFDVSHHTTIQHSVFTFAIEGIAVGDVTFGLHLTSPFYNSDQRSGRFCSKMFINPDFDKIIDYLRFFWPEVTISALDKTISFIKDGAGIYHDNISQATELAMKILAKERPRLSDEAIANNAAKIAQEQLRMFIPIVFPTALDFTVNLSALVALWESAWTPALRYVTDQMKSAVLNDYPNLAFMFNEKRRRQDNWTCQLIPNSNSLIRKPKIERVEIIGQPDFIKPNPALMHPVDKLHFTPELMDNNIAELIIDGARMSIATMGQDQRHRTIRRGQPIFTGEFYMPPIVDQIIDQNLALDFFQQWQNLYRLLPSNMAMIIAPYGTVVCYDKSGSLNAIFHEQGKRLCWCAQEEIYHLSLRLRELLQKSENDNSSLIKILEPPCMQTGKCAEGARYCGRDLSLKQLSQRRV